MVLRALSQPQVLQWVVHEPVTEITLTSSLSSHRQISLFIIKVRLLIIWANVLCQKCVSNWQSCALFSTQEVTLILNMLVTFSVDKFNSKPVS